MQQAAAPADQKLPKLATNMPTMEEADVEPVKRACGEVVGRGVRIGIRRREPRAELLHGAH
jgi:hypothetical protein